MNVNEIKIHMFILDLYRIRDQIIYDGLAPDENEKQEMKKLLSEIGELV